MVPSTAYSQLIQRLIMLTFIVIVFFAHPSATGQSEAALLFRAVSEPQVRVTVATERLNVRKRGGVNYEILGTVEFGESGLLIFGLGPTIRDSLFWWNIWFDNGLIGWVASGNQDESFVVTENGLRIEEHLFAPELPVPQNSSPTEVIPSDLSMDEIADYIFDDVLGTSYYASRTYYGAESRHYKASFFAMTDNFWRYFRTLTYIDFNNSMERLGFEPFQIEDIIYFSVLNTVTYKLTQPTGRMKATITSGVPGVYGPKPFTVSIVELYFRK